MASGRLSPKSCVIDLTSDDEGHPLGQVSDLPDDASPPEFEMSFLDEYPFQGMNSRDAQQKGYLMEKQKSLSTPQIDWVLWSNCIGMANIVCLLQDFSDQCAELYVGLTLSPTWRYWGHPEHRMHPHKKRWNHMSVVSSWNKSYAASVEAFVIEALSECPKVSLILRNAAPGGAVFGCPDEICPVYLYCAWTGHGEVPCRHFLDEPPCAQKIQAPLPKKPKLS